MLGLVRAGITGDRSSESVYCLHPVTYNSCTQRTLAAINILLYRRIAYESSTPSTRRAPTSLRSTRVLTVSLFSFFRPINYIYFFYRIFLLFFYVYLGIRYYIYYFENGKIFSELVSYSDTFLRIKKI